MSDPVARYASHKQAWSRNIFLNSGASRRPYTPIRGSKNAGVRHNAVVSSLSFNGNRCDSSTNISISGATKKKNKKKKGAFVVPTNKRRDDVRNDIRSKMRMVRMMAAQAGKRGGNRGASRAKQPSSFRIPSSKKRQALRWEIRGKMLSPA
jgi:hypothetical protein